jgi:hypothetical protein
MALSRCEVIEQIRTAFRGVVLGDGVGLLEGQGIDGYANEATCKAYREQDEKENWNAIPSEHLNECYSSLSFFDAEGMRFHLPAFLLAEIEGTFKGDVLFHLTELNDYSKNQFSILSNAQKTAVRNYLLFVREDSRYEFDRTRIDHALETYWDHNVMPELQSD